jgi:hypothetical protein
MGIQIDDRAGRVQRNFAGVIAVLMTIWRLVLGIPQARRLMNRVSARFERAVKTLFSLPTAKLGELLLLVQVATLALFAWYFWPLIMSMLTLQMHAAGWIGELRPSNVSTHEWAGEFLTLALVAFSFARYRLIRLRIVRGDNQSVTTPVAGITAIALCVLSLSVQNRVLHQNRSERVLYGSETCYLVGTHLDDALLFCPLRFPRSLTVKVNGVTRTGIIENVFSPLDRN